MLIFKFFTTKLTFWLPVVISKANDSILASPLVAILEIGGHIEMIWTLNDMCIIKLLSTYHQNHHLNPFAAILRLDSITWYTMAAILEIGGHIEMIQIFE